MLNPKSIIISAAIALSPVYTQTASATDVSTEVANPVANEKATVTCGNARFTVLTPQMIRMEWCADGKWEDNKSLTFVNRRLDVPRFKSSTSKLSLIHI